MESKRPKILFLEAAAGGGHISITTAIVQELRRRYPEAEIIRQDILPALLQKFYRLASRQFIDAYSWFYKATDKQKGNEVLSTLDRAIYRKKIMKLIHVTKPDLIFSNVYFASNEVPLALKQLGYQIPFFIFVSDPFSPFSSFFSDQADFTFVSSLACYDLGLHYGLDPRRILITGHPVRREFFDLPENMAKHRMSLGLRPDVFTILLGGSGHGADKVLEILLHLGVSPSIKLRKKILKLASLEYKTFYKLLSQDLSEGVHTLPPVQFICVTGDNTGLKTSLEQLEFPKHISAHIYGKVSNMAQLIQASDLVVGKAGPNVIFEAVASLKPLIITNHIKGQETENLDFVKYAQIGFVEEDPQRAAELIKLVISYKEILAYFLPNLQFVRSQHENAAKKIVDAISDVMKSSLA